jgi:hypothetical protein
MVDAWVNVVQFIFDFMGTYNERRIVDMHSHMLASFQFA